MKISVIAPVYNEAESLSEFVSEVSQALKDFDYELILVDDGSKDESWKTVHSLASMHVAVKGIKLQVNRGQTAALQAGLDAAAGDIIVPIDSDLENDPRDIPTLVEKLEEGYDVASGWRTKRWSHNYGSFLKRKLPSMFANMLISKISKVPLHDYGCVLKAYRREFIVGTRLYGDMHRFIAAYAVWNGAKIIEVPVNYRVRKFGKSNYGVSRTFKVILDLVFMRFVNQYLLRPIQFFGNLGLWSFFFAFIFAVWAIWLKFTGTSFILTPLPVMTALSLMVGVQLIGMGVLAEMIMRAYFESQNKRTYVIKDTVNL